MSEESKQGAYVLIVEDDSTLSHRLEQYLEQYSFAATAVSTLDDASDLLQSEHFDAVLLDLDVAGADGLDLLRTIQRRGGPPVLIISGKGAESDRVSGIEMGAVDYLVKPFSFRELVARLRGVVRRQTLLRDPQTRRHAAQFAHWTFELESHFLIDQSGRRVDLTDGEFSLLGAFVENPRRVLARHELLALTRKDASEVFPRVIDVLVTRLRQKIEADPRNPALLTTVRGAGYRFEPYVEWTLVS